jgi:hypothetical protein
LYRSSIVGSGRRVDVLVEVEQVVGVVAPLEVDEPLQVGPVGVAVSSSPAIVV